MNNHKVLLNNIDKIHTTELGIIRIKKNLNLNDIDVVDYIKNIILNEKIIVNMKGKNYYIEKDNIIITINRHNYVIITAHIKRK